jgi:hypothetical protein
MMTCWQTETNKRPSAKQIVSRLREEPIGAKPAETGSDWDPSHTSKFRSTLWEHALKMIDDWVQVSILGLYTDGYGVEFFLCPVRAASDRSRDLNFFLGQFCFTWRDLTKICNAFSIFLDTPTSHNAWRMNDGGH